MAPSDSPVNRLAAGTLLSHYRIDQPLGAGGMGVVYRATDIKLNRTVAVKVIGAEVADLELRKRFLKEARAASAISHPNIVTIYEVDSAGDIDFIAMELFAGESLDKRIMRGVLVVDEAIAIAEQIAAALAAAHEAGIVHRDIKPANVMITGTHHVKLLDFGVAKQLARPVPGDAATMTFTDPTRPGAVIGSVSYMSPEQAQGRAVDGRSDIFALGVLLYEALTGRRPFSGTTAVETVAKILEATPPLIQTVRSDVPSPLLQLIDHCLQKDRGARPTADEFLQRIVALRRSRESSTISVGAFLRRRSVAISLAAAIVVGAVAAALWWESGREGRELRRRVPELLELAARDDTAGFYQKASAVVGKLPDDERLQQAWLDMTFAVPKITSEPAGAMVLAKGYRAATEEWIEVGHTPIHDARLPRENSRIRIEKDGFTPYEGTLTIFAVSAVLDPVGTVPEGMTRIPVGSATNEKTTFQIPDFWMDRREVTNREFKAFVDVGGYTDQKYWKERFFENNATVPWATAIGRFRDRTGRPGPATWELGRYPDGQAEYPVAGLSWFEAAAFAVYAGKSLPSAFQWRRAADFTGPSGVFSDILLTSNFGAKGPVATGSLHNIGPFGQFDMAGNVKEWCWNESRDGNRMILGGAWNEPMYMYEDRDAQSPFARRETYGLRLVKNIVPQPDASLAYVPPVERDFSTERPADDVTFSALTRAYSYDRGPMNEMVERNEEAPDWRRETVTIDAAYGSERILVYVYLPKDAVPPYQPVVYFPGGDAPLLRSSRQLNLTYVDFVIRSGRALVYPVYKGTYERLVTINGPNDVRDVAIARNKDIRRAIDYVFTRKDLDHSRTAFYGVSLGAYKGVLVGALEPRLKALVLFGTGLPRVKVAPEIDSFQFAPRVHQPTLLIGGDTDFQNPMQGSQLPLFRTLGVAPNAKRHARFNGGHMPYQIHDVMREILDWFDRFLGPVKTVARAGTN